MLFAFVAIASRGIFAVVGWSRYLMFNVFSESKKTFNYMCKVTLIVATAAEHPEHVASAAFNDAIML